MKSAISEAPKPKPTSTAVALFWKMNTIVVAPIRPRPTVKRPVMPPVRKATLSAGGSLPSRAAAAVRTLPRTDRLMPIKPVMPEKAAPHKKATARAKPDCTKLSATTPSGRTTFVAVKNTSTKSGTTMMAMVLNWRRRKASAPSWIAAAISRMVSVPVSAASTPRIK